MLRTEQGVAGLRDVPAACLSEARKILRQAHHILAGLGDDALTPA